MSSSSTDVLERPDVRDADTDQPPEMFHYVRKNKIAESAVMGTLVEAPGGGGGGPAPGGGRSSR
jgi:hypothetical protein